MIAVNWRHDFRNSYTVSDWPILLESLLLLQWELALTCSWPHITNTTTTTTTTTTTVTTTNVFQLQQNKGIVVVKTVVENWTVKRIFGFWLSTEKEDQQGGRSPWLRGLQRISSNPGNNRCKRTIWQAVESFGDVSWQARGVAGWADIKTECRRDRGRGTYIKPRLYKTQVCLAFPFSEFTLELRTFERKFSSR